MVIQRLLSLQATLLARVVRAPCMSFQPSKARHVPRGPDMLESRFMQSRRWCTGATSNPKTADSIDLVEDETEEDEDEDEYLEVAEPQHIIIKDDFSPVVQKLREHYDSRVGSPLQTRSDRFVWDYWHVPGQYALLRTPADHFFPKELYDKLEDSLIEFGETVLGCRGISPIWLSYYIHGCRQELHTDNPHGPWAFVLSLTDWEGRPFSGGETMILKPHVLDYWRGFDPSKGVETPQMVTKVEPHFNRLTAFDPRFPHGVCLVEGTMDPQKARIVLHGWFTQPTPFFQGGLSQEAATPTLNSTLDHLYTALEDTPPTVGTLVVRLEVGGKDGRVRDLHWLTHTLVSRPQSGMDPQDAVDEVAACVAEHLMEATFPASEDGSDTLITVPFVFE